MIVVALPCKINKVIKFQDNNTKWCYLGKDVTKRAEISDVLGNGKRFYLKDRLCKVAEELCQPYLDFVAELGRHQKNQLHWWASSFASKSPIQTDFYLLFCYKALINKLIDEYQEAKFGLCIIVEDPWLFTDIKSTCNVSGEIKFIGSRLKLTTRASWLFVRGILSRIVLVCRYVIRSVVVLYYSGAWKHTRIQRDNNTVGIFSFVEKRCFSSNGYDDPYTDGLSDLLEKNNIKVIRPVNVVYPISFAKIIAKLKKTLWPLILEFRIQDIYFIIKYWKPYIPSGKFLQIRGYSIKKLITREMLEEFSKPAFNTRLILYKIMKRFFKKNWCHSFVYVYENQPWEKIVCMAAKGFPDLKLIGYQHATISKFLFMYFLGKGEKEFMPLPDRVLVNGPLPLELLEKDGYPEKKLILGGMWKFRGLTRMEKVDVNERTINYIKILIALPVDKSMARLTLQSIISSFPDGGNRLGIEFLIKAHPDVPLSKLGMNSSEFVNFHVVEKTFQALLKNVEIVVSSSTPSIEALLQGKIVIRIIPENLIDMDPLAGFDTPGVIVCYEGEFKEKVFKAIETLRKRQNAPQPEIENVFFSNIDPNVWLNELSGTGKKNI